MISQARFNGGATWQGDAAATLNRLSDRVQVFSVTAARNCDLPDATTMPRGEGGPNWYILNLAASTFNVTVRDNAAGTVATLTPGDAAIICLIDSSTAAGNWFSTVRTINSDKVFNTTPRGGSISSLEVPARGALTDANCEGEYGEEGFGIVLATGEWAVRFLDLSECRCNTFDIGGSWETTGDIEFLGRWFKLQHDTGDNWITVDGIQQSELPDMTLYQAPNQTCNGTVVAHGQTLDEEVIVEPINSSGVPQGNLSITLGNSDGATATQWFTAVNITAPAPNATVSVANSLTTCAWRAVLTKDVAIGGTAELIRGPWP